MVRSRSQFDLYLQSRSFFFGAGSALHAQRRLKANRRLQASETPFYTMRLRAFNGSSVRKPRFDRQIAEDLLESVAPARFCELRKLCSVAQSGGKYKHAPRTAVTSEMFRPRFRGAQCVNGLI